MTVQPWMLRREGETEAERGSRVARTCYACGFEAADMAKCDEHEKKCPKARQGKH